MSLKFPVQGSDWDPPDPYVIIGIGPMLDGSSYEGYVWFHMVMWDMENIKVGFIYFLIITSPAG